MNKNLKVEHEIEISATPEEIWDMLINPKAIKQYFFGTEAITDWKTGSPIVFQGVWDGKLYQDKGLVLSALPGKLLSYEYWSSFTGLEDKKENYSLVTFAIVGLKEKSILRLTQKGFANEEAQQHSDKAWKNVLEKIREIAENSVNDHVITRRTDRTRN
jgi:uncharacterized protein YndB with AHSA1/START domain